MATQEIAVLQVGFGLVWSGLVWSGLVWSGQIGLDRVESGLVGLGQF